MNKVAVLIPTWCGHYDFYLNFIKSLKSNEIENSADVFCVLSYDEDVSKYKGTANILTIPEELQSTRESGIINKKKIWGDCPKTRA